MKYVAFLRGINVSGQKLIKMDELSRIFTSMGFKNVKTLIQSGNVVFETSKAKEESLRKKIEKGLLKSLGYEVDMVLRTMDEIELVVKWNPFKKINTATDKPYVAFMATVPGKKIKTPWFTARKDVEIVLLTEREAFCLVHPQPDNRGGFPNAYVEKEFKVIATTRNWNTVNKLLLL